ncbi:MAG: TIGR00266 family protein [Crenarchaeota archaeon]|nr:TIGR00266 family protein [Thermoproteota archaeon]
MKWNVTCKPSYSLLKVELEPGENVTAEPGAMVYMKGDIEIKTSSGGILKGIMRSMLGGESFWLNTYRARSQAEIWFAPSLPGDIEALEIDGKGLIIQDTSYLAHHGDISIGTAWRGFRGLLAEGELFWLKAEGHGLVWVTSYGGLEKLELKPGERVIVDNFHFVAMDNGMKWKVRKFGGLKSFLFGGEGLVIEVEGPGRLVLQTRSLPPFIGLISKYIRK